MRIKHHVGGVKSCFHGLGGILAIGKQWLDGSSLRNSGVDRHYQGKQGLHNNIHGKLGIGINLLLELADCG